MDDFTALRLQIEWGADEALEAEPVDRLRAVTDPISLTPPPNALPQGEAEKSHLTIPAPFAGLGREADQGRGEGAAHAPSRATPAERALQAATSAPTLEALRAAIAGFDGCALRDTAGHLVFAEGDPSGGLLLIGDAPGAAEDRSGAPFAGPAGAYLDRMLASIGLERRHLLLTPLIPWRPPGDRPPSQAELMICLPFLCRLIVLAAPRRLVLLGSLPARTVLGQAGSRRRVRGTWQEAAIPGLAGTLPALPTFSPGELMRKPGDRRTAWADLRLLRRTLDAAVV
jgi:uracil-DNA glycosylase